MDFWQIGDIASVGFLGSLILSNLGCFFSGCGIGIQSNFLAVNMVGFVGKRFPTQLVEAGLLLLGLYIIWSTAIRFHPRGKIVGLSVTYIGLVKLIVEPLKASHDEGLYLSLVLFCLGATIFYKATKRNPIFDLKICGSLVIRLITNKESRGYALARFQKYWYNRKTSIFWKFRSLKKNLRRINVRFSYKNTKLY